MTTLTTVLQAWVCGTAQSTVPSCTCTSEMLCVCSLPPPVVSWGPGSDSDSGHSLSVEDQSSALWPLATGPPSTT